MTPSVPPALPALCPEAAFAARIGSGACGEVWLARFPGGAFRAVKFVAAAPGRGPAPDRERRALRLLRSLADPARPGAPLHPALLPVLDFRENADGFACTMPPADSLRPNWAADPAAYRPRTLASELLARRALPLGECIALAEALAVALDFLQRHCLVHRDIKPSNVLYLHGRPVLADFGLLADTREADSIVGTPGYVPEEQHGRFPADIYSLGILLSGAATGRPAAETGYAPVEEADTDHPLFPRFLDLLRRATSPNPALRPQTAAAFLKELRALSAPPAPSKWRKLLRWTALACALGLIGAICTVAQRRRPSRELPSPAPAARPAAPIAEPLAEPPPAAEPAAPAPLPAADIPAVYLAPAMIDHGAFLQFYADRIRVGLPRPGVVPEDCSLLLFYPPNTPRQPWMEPSPAVPCCILPVEAATAENTPPTFATDPVFPEGAVRTAPSGIVALPPAAPYPEAVFYLYATPAIWHDWMETHPGADFGDLEVHWISHYVFRH